MCKSMSLVHPTRTVANPWPSLPGWSARINPTSCEVYRFSSGNLSS
jgi:hypothetical protein